MTEDFNKDSLKESYGSRYEFYILISRINGDRRYSPAHSRPRRRLFCCFIKLRVEIAHGSFKRYGRQLCFTLVAHLLLLPPLLKKLEEKKSDENMAPVVDFRSATA